jgi:hypothetical protein
MRTAGVLAWLSCPNSKATQASLHILSDLRKVAVACGLRNRSIAEHCQVQLAQLLGVGDDINLRDLVTRDGQAQRPK